MRVIGNGSVVQRDKTKPRSRCRDWELSVKVDDHGEKRRRTRAFHGTWTQAQAALKEFVSELESEGAPLPDVTVSDYMNMWVSRRMASASVAQRTVRTDVEKLRPVRDRLGDAMVRDLSPDDIRDVYEGVMRGETPSGRKWSASSVVRMHAALSKMLSDAVDDGVIAESPAEKVSPPRSKADSEGKAMPPDDMDALLSSLDWSRPQHRAVGLAVGCGLRRSEICALEWPDVRDDCVTVVKSAGDDGSVDMTKNRRSRTVPMPNVVADGMESARSRGRVVDMLPHSLSRWWRRNAAKMGCDGYRFHDLRHSYATRLAASGVNMRVLMELCGWTSVEMAARVYTHVSTDMQRDAVSGAFSDSVRVSCGKSGDGKRKGQRN